MIDRLSRRASALPEEAAGDVAALVAGRGAIRQRLARSRRDAALGRPLAHPRRLPPRPGADRAERRRDHRLRGRAGPQPRRAAGEVLAAARRRRHAALVRLRGVDGARPAPPGFEHAPTSGRWPAPGSGATRPARPSSPPIASTSQGAATMPDDRALADGAPRALPAAEGDLRNPATSSATDRHGCAFRFEASSTCCNRSPDDLRAGRCRGTRPSAGAMSQPGSIPFAWGPELTPEGARFRLWAPGGRAVGLRLEGRDLPMARTATAGSRPPSPAPRRAAAYAFVLDDGTRRARPRRPRTGRRRARPLPPRRPRRLPLAPRLARPPLGTRR